MCVCMCIHAYVTFELTQLELPALFQLYTILPQQHHHQWLLLAGHLQWSHPQLHQQYHQHSLLSVGARWSEGKLFVQHNEQVQYMYSTYILAIIGKVWLKDSNEYINVSKYSKAQHNTYKLQSARPCEKRVDPKCSEKGGKCLLHTATNACRHRT